MNVSTGREKIRSRLRPLQAHGRAVLAFLLLAALVVGGVIYWTRASPGGTPRGTAGPGGAGSQAAGACAVSAILVPRCGAWWGMYTPASPGGAGLGGAVAQQEQRLGRPLDIVKLYHDMSTGQNGTFPSPAEQELGRNHLLLFSWAPVVWSTGTEYSWNAVASGSLDRSVIIPEAKRLRAFPHTVFLTFAPEPDAAIPGNGSAAQYVAAWRHIHDVFSRLGVRNVVWVWATTGYMARVKTIAATYPGNAYVDWIGYDPYNYFTCHHTAWRSFAQTVGPFYRWITAQHFGGKPIMLAEYSTAADPADPGRAASWYRAIVPTLLELPRIKALVLWNSAVPGCDLRLNAASAAAVAAYRQAGLSPYLRQAIP
jgi:hypothetical protein